MSHIIAPLNQLNYFTSTLFFQYLGTESGSRMLRDYINPAYTDVSNGIEHTYQTILDAFDINTAVGVQLDTIGSFVGLPRPSFSSIGLAGFFGFDGLPNQPFDIGEFADGRITEDSLVNDDKYRGYIRIKIAKNVWNGTRVGLKALLANAVDADTIVINNAPPSVELIGFQFDTPGAGWDEGAFEGGVLGLSTPATFRILLGGGTITQEEVDQLLLLDLFPTPQGVLLDEVLTVQIVNQITPDGFNQITPDGFNQVAKQPVI